MLFYNLVTTMVARLSQGCTNIVTRLYEQCHKVATIHLVITLYFETVARLLQGGGKAVTKALSQPCIMIMNSNKIVKLVFQNVHFYCAFLPTKHFIPLIQMKFFENSQLTLFFF